MVGAEVFRRPVAKNRMQSFRIIDAAPAAHRISNITRTIFRYPAPFRRARLQSAKTVQVLERSPTTSPISWRQLVLSRTLIWHPGAHRKQHRNFSRNIWKMTQP